MTKILKVAVEYLGVGLVLLGGIIVFATLHANGFNGYILGVGVLLIVVPIGIYIIVQRLTGSVTPPVRDLRDLKQTGIRIPVDLTACKIKSTSWTTEVERYDSPRIVFLNEISGHSDKNVEQVVSNLSRVEYTCTLNGKRRKFLSPAIAKDKVTLRLLLEMQMETAVYIDRDNSKYYFFDLDFIYT